MRLIVVGCGRMGSGLAEALSLQGHQITVVDRDAAALGRLPAAFAGRTICAEGLDHAALLEAGIERADGLTAVTTSDETNVVAARVARQHFHVPKVVARVCDPRRADLYQRLGVQTISTTAWGIHRVAELLLASHLQPVGSVGSGGVELMETALPHTLAGRTPADLALPGEACLVAVTRNGATFLPVYGAVLQEDDLLHLAVAAGAGERVRQVLGIG